MESSGRLRELLNGVGLVKLNLTETCCDSWLVDSPEIEFNLIDRSRQFLTLNLPNFFKILMSFLSPFLNVFARNQIDLEIFKEMDMRKATSLPQALLHMARKNVSRCNKRYSLLFPSFSSLLVRLG
jgi:hypothetical protein